jgi:type II secretory pathway component PulJ
MSFSGRESSRGDNPCCAVTADRSSQPPPEKLGDAVSPGLSRRGWLPADARRNRGARSRCGCGSAATGFSGRESSRGDNPCCAVTADRSSQPPPEKLGDAVSPGLSRRGWRPIDACCSRRSNQQAGFSLVELLLAGALVTILLLALTESVQSGQHASRTMNVTVDLTESLRRSVQRLSEELRTATRLGEDANDNAVLDPGEDGNGNGRLDADWAVTTQSLTFNRFLPNGLVSLPITYRLNGSDLERVATIDTTGNTVRAPIDRSLSGYTVADDGQTVTITIAITKVDAGGKTQTGQETVRITPRN